MTEKHRHEFEEWLNCLARAIRDPLMEPLDAVAVRAPDGTWFFAFSATIDPEKLTQMTMSSRFYSGASTDRGVLAERLATGLMTAAGASAELKVPK